jgi:hypothetical protein
MRAADHADNGLSSLHAAITTDPVYGGNDGKDIVPRANRIAAVIRT